MDSREVSVQKLALFALAALWLVSASGCGRRTVGKSTSIGKALKREVMGHEKDDPSPINVTGIGSSFTVDNKAGQRVLAAKLAGMEGTVQPGQGVQGAVQMRGVDALLYDKGQPSMTMTTPAATWVNKQLITDKTAHGVSADKKTVLDAQKAVWTSEGNLIDLEQAKVQGIKDGKPDFTAEGPKAHVADRWVTMNSGARTHNEEGQQMTADRMRWHLDIGKLEANGNVVVTEEGTRISGPHLNGNTKLRRGRFTGRTRVWMKSTRALPGPKPKTAPVAPGKKSR